MTKAERDAVDAFAAAWLQEQGYNPAPFQKAIALQRLRRGESVPQIIAALISQRV